MPGGNFIVELTNCRTYKRSQSSLNVFSLSLLCIALDDELIFMLIRYSNETWMGKAKLFSVLAKFCAVCCLGYVIIFIVSVISVLAFHFGRKIRANFHLWEKKSDSLKCHAAIINRRRSPSPLADSIDQYKKNLWRHREAINKHSTEILRNSLENTTRRSQKKRMDKNIIPKTKKDPQKS